jgi:hypothetical protein
MLSIHDRIKDSGFSRDPKIDGEFFCTPYIQFNNNYTLGNRKASGSEINIEIPLAKQ